MNIRSSMIQKIESFMGGAIETWRGIDAGCRIADLREAFQIDMEWASSGILGDDECSLEYVYAPESAKHVEARLWYDERGELCLLDMATTRAPLTSDVLIDKLGKPKKRLDAWIGLVYHKKCEWVYPHYGMTFFVHSSSKAVKHVAGYSITSLEDYRVTLRLSLQTKRIPIR